VRVGIAEAHLDRLVPQKFIHRDPVNSLHNLPGGKSMPQIVRMTVLYTGLLSCRLKAALDIGRRPAVNLAKHTGGRLP
jgi:hypothetical protein